MVSGGLVCRPECELCIYFCIQLSGEPSLRRRPRPELTSYHAGLPMLETNCTGFGRTLRAALAISDEPALMPHPLRLGGSRMRAPRRGRLCR